MSSRFVHAGISVRISFLFRTEEHSIRWIDHILLIRSSFSGPSSCSHIMAVCEQCCYEHGCMTTSSSICFQFFLKILYLFLFGCAWSSLLREPFSSFLLSSCGAWTSQSGGFSGCRAPASVVAAHSLSSRSSQVLGHRLSSCSTCS